MLRRLALLAITAPRRILVVAALLTIGFGALACSVTGNLSAGGGYDANAESSRAMAVMSEKFGQSGWQLLVTVTDRSGALDGPARDVGMTIVDHLSHSPDVASVISPWTVPPQESTRLLSRDATSGLIVANIQSTENTAPVRAETLTKQLPAGTDGVAVRVGGPTMFASQMKQQAASDLVLMESIAIPLSFLVLVWVFGGLIAAALPVAVGVIAIVGSMAALMLVSLATEVSIFALNLSVGLGFALAVDYTLLMVNRYRDELADGATRDEALLTTLSTAGRTVSFSAVTVALSMVAMILFPMSALRSLAYAGIVTVGFAAASALLVAPAAIVLLGDRLNSLDVRRPLRRALRLRPAGDRALEQQFLYRTTKQVMRHAVPVGIGVVVLLLLLGMPFGGVQLGVADDRMLPTSTQARQVGDQLRDDYPRNEAAAITIVVPDVDNLAPAELDRYAERLSRVIDVSSVSSPGGTYVSGARVGPPSAATGIAAGSAFLTVDSAAPSLSTSSDVQLDRLHQVAGPAGRSTLISGAAQINRDNVEAIARPLPWVLAVMAATVFVLLFLLTGSVVVPVKALLLSVLSLTVTFGALVWLFQDGHLGAFGTTATGTLAAIVPVPLFFFAFALSMDYEVFLVARIREHWLESGRTQAENDESVALGLAKAGRVVTAAAVLMAIPFAALIGAQVSIMRMFGVGLTLALLVDATLIRMVLLPAFMHLLGPWNWWAPKPLARLHRRLNPEQSPTDAPNRLGAVSG
ncbi:MMPL family transporter [Mycobacterium sp. 3519A]|uniref:MMPL family transporter n=1 Tax=Mycobacterium sp. 3519A TaxID=2057184 RepID=UPI000C7C1627|nr:MMPL family transporter [Mycobacterium sp. 3519A]